MSGSPTLAAPLDVQARSGFPRVLGTQTGLADVVSDVAVRSLLS